MPGILDSRVSFDVADSQSSGSDYLKLINIGIYDGDGSGFTKFQLSISVGDSYTPINVGGNFPVTLNAGVGNVFRVEVDLTEQRLYIDGALAHTWHADLTGLVRRADTVSLNFDGSLGYFQIESDSG